MTRLMISVRSPQEALLALQCGVDLIDVKEPARGALGSADRATVQQIVRVVAGRCPLSVALGELSETLLDVSGVVGIRYAKIGLARMQGIRDWRDRWQAAVRQIPPDVTPVAVAYVDVQHAPSYLRVLAAARAVGCRALLLDTYVKNGRDLFAACSEAEIVRLLAQARRQRLPVVLAGSLRAESLQRAAGLRPHAIAVRGAVCPGLRHADIDEAAVRAVQSLLHSAVLRPPAGAMPKEPSSPGATRRRQSSLAVDGPSRKR